MTTNGSGHVTQLSSLVAVGGQITTYQVKATFEGTNFQTRNLTITDPYGHDYIVCTTLQWDLKFSHNSVALALGTPKTDAAVSTPASPQDDVTVTQTPETTTVTVPPPKTPEEMQAEANQTGWLTVWHEFTWTYPWYRPHFVLNVAVPPYGTLYVDYGFSLLPFGSNFNANFTVIVNILNDVGDEIATDVLKSFIVGMVIQYVASWALGRTGIAVLVAIASYTLFSMAEAALLYLTSGSSTKAWLASFLSSLVNIGLGIALDGLNAVRQWLTAAARYILDTIQHVMNSMWARGLNFFDITGIAFTLIDFGLMILYLSSYIRATG